MNPIFTAILLLNNMLINHVSEMVKIMFNIMNSTNFKTKFNKFFKSKSNKTESIKHPFYSKERGHYSSNIAYFLLNCDMPQIFTREGLFSVQYEMHRKVKPNVTFVVNFFDKCDGIERPLSDFLDMKHPQSWHMKKPFNNLNRCRYFIPSLINVNGDDGSSYQFSHQFNLANVIFLNILNNRDLGYKIIVKDFLANYFELPELSKQNFDSFSELVDVLSSMDNEQSKAMLDFIRKYKDILFFEDNNCQIFKVQYKDNTSALIELNNIVMNQQCDVDEDNPNSHLSKLFWGDDLMFLYHQEQYTYFFNSDSYDDLFNKFIIQLIEITAKYLNSQTLPFFENSVMYCLYNCDNKNFIDNIAMYSVKKINGNSIHSINRKVDVLSIHYINNELDFHRIRHIIEEYILNKDINRYFLGYSKPVNLLLGNSSSFLMYPLLDQSKTDIYLKQVEYIYQLLLKSYEEYEPYGTYGKKNTNVVVDAKLTESTTTYNVVHQLNDYKTNIEELTSLSKTNIPYKVGNMFCFDLKGYGLMRYFMLDYNCMYPK